MALRLLLLVAYLGILGTFAQNNPPPGELKLNGDTDTAGALEIYMSGSWGTVSFVNFTKEAADVACHQMGYSGAVTFGRASTVSTGPVWLSGPNCTGDELHILRCHWNASPCTAACTHNDDVTVQCNSSRTWVNPYEGSVRIEGATMSTGTVLVYLRGMWGGVCADNFTAAEADSVCRQLGYTDSNGFKPSRVSGSIWLNTFDCIKTEACFTDCYSYPENSAWITDCSSGLVGVSCEYNSSHSEEWSAGTDCHFEFSSVTTTFEPATSMFTATPTSMFTATPTSMVTATPTPSTQLATSTMFSVMSSSQATPTLSSESKRSTSSYYPAASTTQVSIATTTTTTVLPPSNLPVLSGGAIAGIVVGSFFFLLLLVAMALLFCCVCCAKCKHRGYKEV